MKGVQDGLSLETPVEKAGEDVQDRLRADMPPEVSTSLNLFAMVAKNAGLDVIVVLAAEKDENMWPNCTMSSTIPPEFVAIIFAEMSREILANRAPPEES
jgi:hypothetical protein